MNVMSRNSTQFNAHKRFYWVNELMPGSKQQKRTGIEIFTLRASVPRYLMLREKSYRETALSIYPGRESCDLGFFVAWSIVMPEKLGF